MISDHSVQSFLVLPVRFCTKFPSGNFHCLMLSAEAEAIILTPGWTTKERTLFLWLVSVERVLPATKSHNRIVESCDPIHGVESWFMNRKMDRRREDGNMDRKTDNQADKQTKIKRQKTDQPKERDRPTKRGKQGEGIKVNKSVGKRSKQTQRMKWWRWEEREEERRREGEDKGVEEKGGGIPMPWIEGESGLKTLIVKDLSLIDVIISRLSWAKFARKVVKLIDRV